MVLTEEDLQAISWQFEKVLEEKLEEKLDEKLEEKLEEKLDKKLEEKLEEKLDKKLEEKLDKKFEEKLTPIYERLDRLEGETGKIELLLEQDVLPRLQNIETCYISTYRRYQHDCDTIETMQADMDVMKVVLSEHSQKLQHIS